MIRTIDRYLTRLFLTRFAVLLAALGALALLLDVIANADEVVRSADGQVIELLRYSVLRLPDMASRLYAFSVLIAAVLTMTSLVRHSELTALRAAGVSKWRLMAGLLPAALLVALAQFLLDDRLVPYAVDRLSAWGVGDYAIGGGEDDVTWIRREGDVVRIRYAGRGEGLLSEIAIFRRDGAGNMVELIEAKGAEMADRGWTLREVTRTLVGQEMPIETASYAWPGGLAIDVLEMLAVHPREMSFWQVRRFAEQAGFGNRPHYVYELWRSKKILTPLATIVMILLAVPLVGRFDRAGAGALLLASGIVIAFLYLTVDGLLVAMGEAGLLPPLLAASAATVALAAVSGAIAFHHEVKRQPARRHDNRPD